ncbi:FXYD domain-containing ion transport regulator 3 isoform X6 [Peromyscus californicus insignis]|uniref:FXYD domain-containing ion transport regulator 3 isoform X6 n=1 Tax=Peromyscus californicus insignis TaxID=564181 RepID=UPI0022A6C197|nr:FXYD domain-containing ion transport regulator 3 isoform X6 [Peromyscus californicus insignis]
MMRKCQRRDLIPDQRCDMQEVTLSLLVLLAGLPALDANDPEDKDSPFYYGGKCKCKFSQKPSHRPGDGPPLITPGKTLRVAGDKGHKRWLG